MPGVGRLWFVGHLACALFFFRSLQVKGDVYVFNKYATKAICGPQSLIYLLSILYRKSLLTSGLDYHYVTCGVSFDKIVFLLKC